MMAVENVNLEQLIRKLYHSVVDTIAINNRPHYLVFGYLRQLETQRHKICPIEIKNICKSYVEMHIITKFEMELETQNKLKSITMLGAGGVGKSSLVVRLIADEFYREYDPCIEPVYVCTLEVDGIQTELEIVDTYGQQQFAAIRHHWIREASTCMLVYAINSERTFRDIENLMKTILRIKEEELEIVSMILVGNKKDLPHTQRDVLYETGERMANAWGIPFIETSAKTGWNVDRAYKMLVRETRKRLLQRIERIQGENISPNNSCCNIL
eukprot:483775_1